jgi:hypothetical protein
MEWYRVQPYAIAQLTSPGCPLIPNGEEFAEDYWVMEDDQGSGRPFEETDGRSVDHSPARSWLIAPKTNKAGLNAAILGHAAVLGGQYRLVRSNRPLVRRPPSEIPARCQGARLHCC